MNRYGDAPATGGDASAAASGVALRPRLLAHAATLRAAGIDTPRTDTDLLAAHVLGIPRGRLLLVDTLTAEQDRRLAELIARRATRVPLQHLTGTVGFDGLDLAVGPGVFVPRPETELLARWAIDALTGRPAPVVVDLCAGTGALALAIAAARPDATVHAVEASDAAMPWLERNASGTPVRVVHGDAVDPAVLADLDGTVDLVVSNPPYVPDAVPVPPEVADHDPATAVFGGPDGLSVIRPLVARCAALLMPGGLVGVEHDDTHTDAMAEVFAVGFTAVRTHPDLAGRPRFTTAVRR